MSVLSVLKFDVLGSADIGNYGVASNSYLLTLDELTSRKLKRMEETLRVKVLGIRLVNCRVIRPFFAGNSRGLIISRIVDDETVERIKRNLSVNVKVLDSKYTAVGNLIAANDKGCIASPVFSREEIKEIKDVIDVELIQRPVAGATYVGSLLKANNMGGMITPYADDEEMKKIEDILKVDIRRGTVNSGLQYVSAGILVNDRGALVGKLTDGVELMNVTDVFKLK